MIFLFLLFCGVFGDVYMHNPRGANDRNCERNVNRNNGNLLYDTQNNAKGGYACPRAVAGANAQNPPSGMTKRMEFQVGSQLEVEWTNQHGCGLPKQAGATFQNTGAAMDFPNVHCEMVIEMGCSSTFDPAAKYGSFLTGANAYRATPREGIPRDDNDAATNRINTNDNTNNGQAYGTTKGGAAANRRFGMHETAEWYNECNRVQRNKGLFTADQNVNRRSAIGTRQNPNGGRRGLECPEERDYYPYWRPTPFIGVAYLVDDPARCGATGSATAKINHVANKAGCGGWDATATGTPNMKTSCAGAVNQGDWVGNAQGYVVPGAADTTAVWAGKCIVTATGDVPTTSAGMTRDARNKYNRREWPNNKKDCETLAAGGTTIKWIQGAFHAKFATTLTATTAKKFTALMNTGPLCSTIDQSRSNHLGNDGTNDDANRFTMTVPDVLPVGAKSESCIVRLRYNMSSSDYVRNINASFNKDKSPVQQDPLVKIGPATTDVVQLAVNTNQYGRTFQDRSYTFEVVPKAVAGQYVVNVNSRGKRGNIVQVYPAVEYDFVPNEIHLKNNPNPNNPKEYPSGTVLDFQWTGSDYNPRRGCNDAEGGPYTGDNNIGQRLTANTQGSNQNSRNDRNTLCEMQDSRRNYPAPKQGNNVVGGVQGSLFYKAGDNGALARKFAFANAQQQLTDRSLVANAPLQCLTETQIENINNENRRENHPRNCAEGNAISPYFESTPIKVADQAQNKAATFQLYSCRNNNFSNRDTKIQIFYSPPGGAAVPPPAAVKITDVVPQAAKLVEYSSEAQIDAEAMKDVPPINLVENDGYKDGSKQGCTQEMYFGAASTVSSFNVFMALIVSAFYLL